jgi:hypothetical protein
MLAELCARRSIDRFQRAWVRSGFRNRKRSNPISAKSFSRNGRAMSKTKNQLGAAPATFSTRYHISAAAPEIGFVHRKTNDADIISWPARPTPQDYQRFLITHAEW